MHVNISRIIGVLIFLSGILNIISGLFSRNPGRLMIIEDLFPLEFIHLSRTLIILLGIFLLFLAGGIWQRKIRSWWFSIIFITTSIVLHITKGFDYEESILLVIILAILILFKDLFSVKSDRLNLLKSLRTTLAILAVLFVYAYLGYYLFQTQFSNQVTFINITKDYLYSIFGIGNDILQPITRHALWFENSVSTIGVISVSLVFASLFAPLIDERKPTEEEHVLARNIVIQGAVNSTGYFSLMTDKVYFFNSEKNSFIAYKIVGGVAVVLGDPIGKPADSLKTVEEFIRQMEGKGLAYVFYNTSPDTVLMYKKLDLKLIKIGEEAVISTADFSLDTPEMKDIRYGVNRVKKLQMKLLWYPLDQIPWRVLHDVDLLYKNWLKVKKIPALTFSMGFYPFPLENTAYLLAVYSDAQNLLAALSFYPYKGQEGVALDLMVRSFDAPNGTVEGAIANAILHFKEAGYNEINLGMAPLSNISKPKTIMDKAINYIFNNFNQFYGYKYLFKFKEQFNPIWIHKYIAYKNVGNLPLITLSLVRALFPEKDGNKFLSQS